MLRLRETICADLLGTETMVPTSHAGPCSYCWLRAAEYAQAEKGSMIEMALLAEVKETDNKVRWDADMDGTRFSLYIPKWRVPEPLPHLVHVTVSPCTRQQSPTLSPAAAHTTPESRKKPIVAHLRKFQKHTPTIRYQPEGEASAWEVGEPYIPTPMTYGETERLTITVQWE